MTKNVAFSSQDLSQRRVQQMSVPLTPEIYHWYQHMQQSHAVFFDTARSAWLVFRYDDVQRVLVDTQTFSSQREINPDGTVASIMGSGIIGMDPPRHRQLRTLISQAFTPHTVAKLEARITSIANALLDQVEARGKMDIVDDLAFPLPIAVIAELLGVPTSDRASFRAWSADAVGTDVTQHNAAFQALTQDASPYEPLRIWAVLMAEKACFLKQELACRATRAKRLASFFCHLQCPRA